MALTKHNRLTVNDLRTLKGKRQMTMLFVETPEEAAAASAAGIDILSIIEPIWTRDARGGRRLLRAGRTDLRPALHLRGLSARRARRADRSAATPSTAQAASTRSRKLAAEGIPVVGHVGLIPARATWTGGFKAVGKTAAEAHAGSTSRSRRWRRPAPSAAEIEVVPARVAAEISKRTSLVLLSMGAGPAATRNTSSPRTCSATPRGHQPRHAKVYRNFRARIRPVAARADRGLQGIPRRRRDGRLSGGEASRADRRRGVRGVRRKALGGRQRYATSSPARSCRSRRGA